MRNKERCLRCNKPREDFTPFRRLSDPTTQEPLLFRTRYGSIICISCAVDLMDKYAGEAEEPSLTIALPGAPKDKHTHWEFEGRVAALEFKIERLQKQLRGHRHPSSRGVLPEAENE